MKSEVKHLRRVYVWELPVRVYHWLNALTIFVLIATGFWIANPPALQSSAEASHRFLMGWVRYIHFTSAYLFVFNFIFRLYWGFVGNKYARWHNFIPITPKFFKEMWQVIKIDILLLKGKEHLSVGHNAMAGFVYFMMFIAFMVQVFTGFGLYAANSNWWFPQLFAWVPHFVGGDMALRQWHHIAMWFFILFIVVHIYLVFYHDYVEGRGEISSMGGGWKFIEEEMFEKIIQENENKKPTIESKPIDYQLLSKPNDSPKLGNDEEEGMLVEQDTPLK
ncbi:MAG: Ni/Fe-hydrogenase, b-type cytochrome subunit [Microscillaceae bacterium]|jgi:Ni/Fe-hydrogenase 1 B-type cytochrome subunit|nr:Ni/Fe-hydrogenase, b-type cytochrome subunit [Microscillaceae bacterium]